MKRAIIAAALIGVAASPILAGARNTVTGAYVEARTAEVFTGGCIMSSEADTVGKQAVLAWKVDRGSFNGVSLDGLSVVAALSGDANLGIHEIGGVRAKVKSAVVVDERANAAQRIALVAMVTELAKASVGTVVNVTSAPIQFSESEHGVNVATNQVKLDVSKHLDHDPTCGSMQWFAPLAQVTQAEMSQTEEHSFTGSSLGTKWSAPNKRSSYIGSFAY
jgi:hypothetical protein